MVCSFTMRVLAVAALLSIPAFAGVPVFVEALANECRYDEALQVLDATANPFLRSAEETALIRARLILQLGRDEEIVSSTSLSETDADAALIRGLAFANLGRRRDALLALSKALSLGADPLLVETARANAAMGTWDYADAERILVPLVKAEEPLSSALYNLACIRTSQRRLDEAAALVRRAWAIGWRDVPKLRNDPDLDALRRSGLIGDLLLREEGRCLTW